MRTLSQFSSSVRGVKRLGRKPVAAQSGEVEQNVLKMSIQAEKRAKIKEERSGGVNFSLSSLGREPG